jgi:hypothetical protein
MIEELARVVLKRDLPEEKLQAGDVGTVVYVYRGGAAYEVEFVTFGGEGVGVFTVEPDALRELGKGELPCAGAT